MTKPEIQVKIDVIRNETTAKANTKVRVADVMEETLAIIPDESQKTTWNNKQDALSLKTINGESIIGTGNIVVESGGQLWTEDASYEMFGTLVIRKILGYYGGVGTVPAELTANVGKYNAKVGGYTTVKADATTFSGGGGVEVLNSLDSKDTTKALSVNNGYVLDKLGKYFLNKSQKIKGDFYIEDLIDFIDVRSGQLGLISPITGLPIKIWVSTLTTNGGGQTVKLSIESPYDGSTIESYAPLENVNIKYGISTDPVFINNEYVYLRGAFRFVQENNSLFHFPEITIRLRPKRLGVGLNLTTLGFNIYEVSGVSQKFIYKTLSDRFEDKGLVIDSFLDFEQKFNSAFSLKESDKLKIKRASTNLSRYYETKGEVSSVWGQSYLYAKDKTNMEGLKTLTVFTECVSSLTNKPTMGLMRNSSSIPQTSKVAKTANGQWIHPDTCYTDETGIGGYKYWMVNSCYPYAQPSLEDVEVFVSNDGIDWKRVLGVNETTQSEGVPFTIPQSEWSPTGDNKNTFMPIPDVNKTLEFATDSATANMVVKSKLNHDPAILYDNGYVNVYITYNLALDTTLQSHKYIVCYRTNNGVDWEIVREDGSSIPYNNTNAQTIFSKTAGVRNHVRYTNFAPSTIGNFDACPQVVKVATGQYYMYYQRTTAGGDINLIRYTGTSAYQFDFSTYKVCAMDKPLYGRLWHFCVRFYAGTYYLMYDGNMCTSTDGVNFLQPNFPFFWRGAQCDLYKPSFVVGGDGKVKIAYSLQNNIYLTSPLMAGTQTSHNNNSKTNSALLRSLCFTSVAEYLSISDVVTKGVANTRDAYIDVYLIVKNQRTAVDLIYFFPSIRSDFNYKSLNIIRDSIIEIHIFSNTRADGTCNFRSIYIDDRV